MVTSKVISLSAWASTCERAQLSRLYSAASKGGQAASSTMVWFPAQSHHSNSELPSIWVFLLLMQTAKLGSDGCLGHCFVLTGFVCVCVFIDSLYEGPELYHVCPNNIHTVFIHTYHDGIWTVIACVLWILSITVWWILCWLTIHIFTSIYHLAISVVYCVE